MSEPEQDVTVEEAGVSVRKSLNDHQFETLAVVFDVRASTDGPTTVTITDAVPEDVPDDDIGFHPEYGGEHWRAEEGQVVFSREFGPGEQYTTVYGVRDFDGTRADLLAEPAVGVGDVEEVSAIDDLVSPEDSEVVRDVISGERDTLPGLEDEAAPAGEEEPAEVETAEAVEAEDDGFLDEEPALDEPLPGMGGGEADDAGPEEPIADAPTDATAEADEDDEIGEEPAEAMAEGEEAEPAAADDGGIADATVALGDGEPAEAADEVDEADDADGVGAPTAGAEADDTEETTPMSADDAETDESIEEETEPPAEADEDVTDVESVVAEVGGESPSDEAEADGDDEVTVPVTGGIARVLAKELRAGNVSYDDRRLLREELLPEEGSTDARIQHLQNQVADLEAYTEALEAFLDEEGGAQAVLDDTEAKVDDLAEDVAAVEETVADVDDEVYSLGDDIEDVEDDVEDVSRDVDEVSAEVDGVAGDVDQLEGEVAGLRDDVGRIDAIDRRIGQVEDDVSAIHDELADLAEFRDRLSSVFGAGGGMGGGDDADEDF